MSLLSETSTVIEPVDDEVALTVSSIIIAMSPPAEVDQLRVDHSPGSTIYGPRTERLLCGNHRHVDDGWVPSELKCVAPLDVRVWTRGGRPRGDPSASRSGRPPSNEEQTSCQRCGAAGRCRGDYSRWDRPENTERWRTLHRRFAIVDLSVWTPAAGRVTMRLFGSTTSCVVVSPSL